MLEVNFRSFPTITTERLLLREHLLGDVDSLYELRTNENVMRYIDRERPKSMHDIAEMIEKFHFGYPSGDPLTWAITMKDNPTQMIGSIGYYRNNFANFRAEIGYMLHPNFWKKGIISEALKATVTFGFEEMKLHSIQANINPGNEASRQLLLKHGFVKEAYFKEDFYFNGKFLDSEIYGLLNKPT